MKAPPCRLIASARRPQDLGRTGMPEVAFAGRSNVGKSSLLNSLVGRSKLARTSSTPGRTRQIDFFGVGEKLCFVDLPGYGYAKVPDKVREAWRELVEAYFADSGDLCLFVLLVDIRHDPTALDREMLDWLRHHQRPFQVVATKADKLPKSKVDAALRRCATVLELEDTRKPIGFSARTGRGVRELWRTISEATRLP